MLPLRSSRLCLIGIVAETEIAAHDLFRKQALWSSEIKTYAINPNSGPEERHTPGNTMIFFVDGT